MQLRFLSMRQTFAAFGAAAVVGLSSCSKMTENPPQTISTVEEVKAYFAQQNKTVLSFAGYSGLGYEDQEALKRIVVKQYLKILDPEKTIINIGVTPDGIGAVYEWAAQAGFETTGIVSSQALEYGEPVSPFLKGGVFFIQDETWGGYLEGTETLSPTSEAMVSVSDIMVAIGGGEVTCDELHEMQKRNKSIAYIPAEMNHEKALAKAEKKGQPAPEHFLGPLHGKFEPAY